VITVAHRTTRRLGKERMIFRARSSRSLPIFTILLILISAVVLSGCGADTDPANALATSGPVARLEADFYLLIFWMAVAVFILVEGLLVWTIFRFRRRTGDGMPEQTHGNTTLEIVWTIIPCLILAVIAVKSLPAMAQATEIPTGPGTVNVKVIGHQWWWEFQYPDQGVITADELHIPVGTKIALQIESADVIHSFWVPKLGGKVQAIPNQHNTSWIQSDEPGTFRAQCFQLCGTSHANMRFVVVAESKSDFDNWIKNQLATPAAATGDAAKGAQVFQSSACVGCHTVAGTPAVGKIGPNLTHVGSRLTLAGAILDNKPDQLAMWLHDPPAVKPGSLMPNLHLTDDQVSSLTVYLESLK
jgi:cytochrome c oxidase subunit II